MLPESKFEVNTYTPSVKIGTYFKWIHYQTKILPESIWLDNDFDTLKMYNTDSCYHISLMQILWSLSLAEHCRTGADDTDGRIVAIQHLPDQQSVCAATSNGEVLLYNSVICEVLAKSPPLDE